MVLYNNTPSALGFQTLIGARKMLNPVKLLLQATWLTFTEQE